MQLWADAQFIEVESGLGFFGCARRWEWGPGPESGAGLDMSGRRAATGSVDEAAGARDWSCLLGWSSEVSGMREQLTAISGVVLSGKNVWSYDCRQKAMDRWGWRSGVSREAERRDPEGKQARGSKSYDAGLVLRCLIFPLTDATQRIDGTCWGWATAQGQALQVEGGKRRGAGVLSKVVCVCVCVCVSGDSVVCLMFLLMHAHSTCRDYL
ncbi:hypothetical protein BDP55DRAFT_434989 [Colletotrichum godetiae]|uniref:Uncharacterized protein n=1 Tax=Colletotrichum godetiae TaxID=1209918 RepID=A0AAJ0AUW4_9PEZI|nr:uncharacterized protein BDP55DRAFT_434989 [Colletotrichum godetiae]KAK1689285.1 hypothetical protein BDP55DRAFT_434989 [Colletotrichum godetiae]